MKFSHYDKAVIILSIFLLGMPTLSIGSMVFIENHGQINDSCIYYSPGNNATIYFTSDSIVFDLHIIKSRSESHADSTISTSGCAIWVKFNDPNPAAYVEATGIIPTRFNYFYGNNSEEWLSDIPAYSQLIYHNVWQDTDIIFRVDNDGISYDFNLHDNKFNGDLGFTIEGAEVISTPHDYALELKTIAGSMIHKFDQSSLKGSFSLSANYLNHNVNNISSTRSTNLLWSTFLGGNEGELPFSLTIDSLGNPTFAGRTFSPNFPTTPGVYDETHNAGYDAFIAKMSADGSSLIWCTYLGGSGGWDHCYGIELNSSDYPIIVGYTNSNDFPTTSYSFDETFNGDQDGFIAKLSPMGDNLIWSSYLGGSQRDHIFKVVLDTQNNPVFIGRTNSPDFPTTISAYDQTHNGEYDIIISKLNESGSDLIFSTFLGGSGNEYAPDFHGYFIDLTSDNSSVFTFCTSSYDFPVTPGSYDNTYNGSADIIIAKLDVNATNLLWSSFLGGTLADYPHGLGIDFNDNVIVTGWTESPDYPTTENSFSPYHNGEQDVIISKVSPSGDILLWSTFFGGSHNEHALSLSLDHNNNVLLTGWTESPNFPITPDSYDNTYNGGYDIFISGFNSIGNLITSTYFGANNDDAGWSIALDPLENIFICGNTTSINFPVTPDAYDETYNGGIADVFLSMFSYSESSYFADLTTEVLGDPGRSTGVAWVDYDNDADLDIYLANSHSQANRLFRNDGNNIFIDATNPPMDDGSWGQGMAWGDYDNDGDIDVYLANNNSENKLFQNEGDGVFIDVTVAPLDYSGQTRSVAWVDFDCDGDLDLYLANVDGQNMLLLNHLGQIFYNIASYPINEPGPCVGFAWGDYDNDGDQDVYLSMRDVPNKLIRNDGGGYFSDVTTAPLNDSGTGQGVAWGDYDNDLDLDLYLCNYGQPNKLFRNDGDDNFVDVTVGPLGDAGNGQSGTWADFDNDGDLDLFVSNYGQPNKLLVNQQSGVFQEYANGILGDAGDGLGATWGDYDGDGDLDIYLSNNNQPNILMQNQQNFGNHWIHIDLIGTLSNKSCIGARVIVVTGNKSQMREIGSNAGFWSQNSLTVELGLGSYDFIDTLEVIWPVKLEQGQYHTAIMTSVAVDHRIQIVELSSAIVDVNDASNTLHVYNLYQNYPNPFNPQTNITYTLSQDGQIKLSVYDLLGRKVAVLIDDYRPAGPGSVTWDGRDASGSAVASGVYIARLETPDGVQTRKLVVAR